MTLKVKLQACRSSPSGSPSINSLPSPLSCSKMKLTHASTALSIGKSIDVPAYYIMRSSLKFSISTSDSTA